MADKTPSGGPSPSSGAPATAEDEALALDTEVPMPSVVMSSLPPEDRSRMSASEDVAPIQRRIGELRKLVLELLEAVDG